MRLLPTPPRRMKVTFSGKSARGYPRRPWKRHITNDMMRAEKKPAPSMVDLVFNLAGEVGGHEVAEEGVNKDGKAVVDDERYRNPEDGGKDKDSLGKKDDPHDDPEEKEGK